MAPVLVFVLVVVVVVASRHMRCAAGPLCIIMRCPAAKSRRQESGLPAGLETAFAEGLNSTPDALIYLSVYAYAYACSCACACACTPSLPASYNASPSGLGSRESLATLTRRPSRPDAEPQGDSGRQTQKLPIARLTFFAAGPVRGRVWSLVVLPTSLPSLLG